MDSAKPAKAPDERQRAKLTEPMRSKASPFLEKMPFASALNALPDIALILNAKRQILFANMAASSFPVEREASINAFYGKGPGDLLRCLNAVSASRGCGSSERCPDCELAATIAESSMRPSGAGAVRECSLSTESQDLRLRVAASALELEDGEACTLLTISDLSYKKRMVSIDMAFFREIMNNASGIYSLSQMFEQTSPEDKSAIAAKIGRHAKRLCDAIKEQHYLFAAEDGLIGVNIEKLTPSKILRELAWFHSSQDGAQGRIRIMPESSQASFESDKALLFKAMSKLIRSISSSPPFEADILLSCHALDHDRIEFRIGKSKAPSPEQQDRKKGKRGGASLDFYCAKTIVENHLRGDACFAPATEDKGPCFMLRLSRKMSQRPGNSRAS